MATDLDLNRPAEHPFANEMAEREHLNRVRTWLICHNLESVFDSSSFIKYLYLSHHGYRVSAAAKLGKIPTIHEDHVIASSRSWWRTSKYRSPYDIHLCGKCL